LKRIENNVIKKSAYENKRHMSIDVQPK
jgi:hypothetical protein